MSNPQPPLTQSYARRSVLRVIQVLAVLGAFWALSACISMMKPKAEAATPIQLHDAPLMMGSKSAPPMPVQQKANP